MERIKRKMPKKRKGDPKKGGKFERDVSRQLSLWWTEGEDSDTIWRTVSSGARFTNRSKKFRADIAHEAGDLKATKPIAEPLFKYFLMELKRGRNDELDLLDLFDRKTVTTYKHKPYIQQVWEKAEKEAAFCRRSQVLIIFQRTRREPMCILTMNAWANIFTPDSCSEANPAFSSQFRIGENLVIMMRLEEFILHSDPEGVREALLEQEYA